MSNLVLPPRTPQAPADRPGTARHPVSAPNFPALEYAAAHRRGRIRRLAWGRPMTAVERARLKARHWKRRPDLVECGR